MKKITIVGDIMCEPLLMKAAYRNGSYDFHGVFEYVKGMFAEADLVIGNLEAPLAGEKAGYTSELFTFNAPDAFADAIRDAGVDLVLTANNHCFDRGIEGMLRTIAVLDEKNMAHTGTYADPHDRKEAAYFDVNGIRVAVVSYTYGTNYSANRVLLKEDKRYLVNLLRPQTELYYVLHKKKHTVLERIQLKILRNFKGERKFRMRKLMGLQINEAHPDDSLNKETAEPYLQNMRQDIVAAKQKADVVVFCPHIGGQFNAEPGAFSEYVFSEAVQAGCDAVVASHSHVILKSDVIEDVPCFYSLGNFSMSPNSIYLVRDQKPEYGLAVHLYLDGKSICGTSFSILKMIETKKDMMKVIPVDQLADQILDEKQLKQLQADVAFIYKTVTGRELQETAMKKEYFLFGVKR